MRISDNPRPFLTHVLSILFFVAVAGGWAGLSWDKGIEHIKQSDTTSVYFQVVMQYKHEQKTTDQKNDWQWSALFHQVLADQQALYVKYSPTDMNLFYQASFERFLGTVYQVTGDVTFVYRLLVFPLNLFFLLGAYLLFFHLTGKAGLAAIFAFVASLPIAIPVAGEFFGMGPVTIFSRRNLFTAFAPFSIYLFYEWIKKPRHLILAFAFLGLISNLHSSGILLAEILILTYLLYHRESIRYWIYAPIFGLATALFGFIAVWALWRKVESLFSALMDKIIPSAYAGLSEFIQKQGIPEDSEFLFYPLRIYSHLPGPMLHGMTLSVVIIALWITFFGNRINEKFRMSAFFVAEFIVLAYLTFSEFKYLLLTGVAAFFLSKNQYIDSKFRLTHHLIMVTFLASFVGMLLFQGAFFAIDGFPLVADQLRGTRFLGFIIFIWLAVLMSRIDWQNSPVYRKWILILCCAAALLMTLRQDFRSYIRYKDEPDSVALLEAAKWSKAHTPQDAKFLVVSTRFGIVAERNVFLHDRESVTTPGQALFSRMQGNFAELMQLARENRMSYIVVRKDLGESAAAEMFPKYDNQRYVLAKDLGELPVGTIPVYDNQRFALFKTY